MSGSSFRRHEVSSIYVGPDDRYIVSLLVGYASEDVRTPKEAARAALDLTRDCGAADTHWFVYDRVTQLTHMFEQSAFDLEEVDAA